MNDFELKAIEKSLVDYNVLKIQRTAQEDNEYNESYYILFEHNYIVFSAYLESKSYFKLSIDNITGLIRNHVLKELEYINSSLFLNSLESLMQEDYVTFGNFVGLIEKQFKNHNSLFRKNVDYYKFNSFVRSKIQKLQSFNHDDISIYKTILSEAGVAVSLEDFS